MKPLTSLTPDTIDRLLGLVGPYKDAIDLPPAGAWQGMSEAAIWLAIVVQVGVAGASAPAENLRRDMAPRTDWYDELCAMTTPQRHAEIHATLRRFGIRYSNADPKRCLKTAALVKNFAMLQAHGGPRAYVQRLARWPREQNRVDVVIREMGYMKLKGARDWLIGLGLLQDAFAFDVRVLNVLKAFGASLPDDIQTDAVAYARLEAELLERVCQPAGITGAVLDRILYQKYDEIVPKSRTKALSRRRGANDMACA